MLPTIYRVEGNLPAGMDPDKVQVGDYIWEYVENVRFQNSKISAANQQTLAMNFATPIRGLGANRASDGAQQVFIGTRQALYRSNALTTPADLSSMVYNTAASETVGTLGVQWTFSPFGEWMLASNGVDPVQLWKGTGNFETLQQGGATPLPFSRALCLMVMSPHCLVANLPGGPAQIRWCSEDDLEDWEITTTNEAGEFTLRDVQSQITCMVGIGDRIAVYTREEMFIGTYLGAPFYFGFLPALSGIGAWGPQAVVKVGRKNYGWGPQGLWETDGVQYQMTDDPFVQELLQDDLDVLESAKIVAYHEEATKQIIWAYVSKDAVGAVKECDKAICYNYQTGGWQRYSPAFSAALERGVLQWALVAHSYALHFVGTGASNSVLETRALDMGKSYENKFISEIRFFVEGTIDVQVGIKATPEAPVQWVVNRTIGDEWNSVPVNRTSKYFVLRVTGSGEFKLGGFEVLGRLAGATR